MTRAPRSLSTRTATVLIAGALAVPALAAAAAAAPPVGAPDRPPANALGRPIFVIAAQASEEQPSPDELVDMAAVRAGNPKAVGREHSLNWQNDFAVAVTRLQEEFPADFADAGIDQGRGKAWVSFGGAAPDGLSDVLAGVPVDVEVRQGLGWTEAALTAYGQLVHFAVLEEDVVGDVATDIDTATGTVAVTVEPAAGVGRAAAQARLDDRLPQVARESRAAAAARTGNPQAAARFEEAAAAVTLTVEAVEELDSGTETVSGGGSLSTCTAGFSVRSGSYAHGIITAAHCSDTQSYFGRSVLTFRAAHAGTYGDVQFHSSSEASDARFYYMSGATRAITATANPVVGMSICKYGKTTLNTCDEVYKLNQCSGIYCSLAMTHRHHSDSGDSGGPWFWGNTGYGVHQGYKTYLLIERSLFSPVRAGASVLGVTVKLS